MLMSSKMSEARVEEEMEELREFLLSKKVTKPLRRELITQMENYYKKRSAFDENTVLSRLPPKHRKHLLLQLYRTQVCDPSAFHIATQPVHVELAVTTSNGSRSAAAVTSRRSLWQVVSCPLFGSDLDERIVARL